MADFPTTTEVTTVTNLQNQAGVAWTPYTATAILQAPDGTLSNPGCVITTQTVTCQWVATEPGTYIITIAMADQNTNSLTMAMRYFVNPIPTD